MHPISRRRFVALTGAGVASAPLARAAHAFAHAIPPGITAQQVVDRIRTAIGGDWPSDTTDTFKAGDPSTAVTGVVTTALPSLAVLDKAVKAHANLIITCEPTFYSHADTSTPPVRRLPPGAPPSAAPPPPPAGPDPVFDAKADFLRKHNLVVWRFSDHWRLRQPDPFAAGLAEALRWPKPSNGLVTIPQTTLAELIHHTKNSLGSRGGIRVVGDPKLPIRTVALLPGSTPIADSLKMLPQADVILAGEVREWEGVEYVRDTVDLGGKKALITIGRTVSEQPGMIACAEWLKPLIPELISTAITPGDPYWRPNSL